MFQPITFTEEQCGQILTELFSPEMADYEGYRVHLIIIYTDGKGPSWSGFTSGPHTMGVMTGAFLIPKSRIAAGSVLIDLKACVTAVTSGKLSLRLSIGGGPTHTEQGSTSLPDARYKVIHVLGHELFHVIQGWRAGNKYDGDELIEPGSLRYTETFNRLRDHVRRTQPDRSSAYVSAFAHAHHPTEQEAERLTAGRLQRFRHSIEQGNWDKCLPIDALKSYVH